MVVLVSYHEISWQVEKMSPRLEPLDIQWTGWLQIFTYVRADINLLLIFWTMLYSWIKYTESWQILNVHLKCKGNQPRNTALVTKMVDLDVNQNKQPQQARVSLWQARAESFRWDCCLEEWSGGLWEPVSAQFPCSAHILRVNPCPGASWAAQSHVSSPHSSLGPLKWAHPPGALRTTKTTNTGLSRLLSETHRCTLACTHAHTHTPTVNSPFIFGTMERQ